MAIPRAGLNISRLAQIADFFAPAIQSTDKLLVPTVSLYEVFERILQQRGEGDALQAIALMQQGIVVVLTAPLALAAAGVSCDIRIPVADSMMLATARAHGATLWSQDSDFEELTDVRYIGKRSA